MNDKYIAQAATQEEAIQKGLDALGISRSEAKITIQEPGKKGFLGIGQKDAIVVVERKEKVNLVSEMLDDEPVSIPEVKAEESEDVVEEDIDPESEVDNQPEEKLTDDEEDLTADEEVEEEKDSVPAEIRQAQQDQQAIDDIAAYLESIIHSMGITDAKVYASRVDNRVTYDVETEDAGLVIGRHGKVLNGLQTLAQNHMHQLAFNKLFVKVDAEKYRSRRQDTVEYLARKTAERVIKTGRPASLNPMPAHERKQIHRYLNDYPEVTTHSEGKEPHRYLVVELAEED